MEKNSSAVDARVDPGRLAALLDGINSFGRNSRTGGFNRIGYSDADFAARRWLMNEMRADGLAVAMDAVGNVFGRYGPGEGPCVMAGSHLDTVPEGGAFDGALGVAVALECVRALRDAGFAPAVPIEVAALAEEEGRFGGMLGSQAASGTVPAGWVEAAVDAEGTRLVDAMRAQGLDPARAVEAARPPGSVRAWLELHIEQGPILEAAGRSVGIARAVSGVCNLTVRLEGRANHSGTTPMELRADAVAGLAEVAVGIPEIIATAGTPEARITIGRVVVAPNFPHTVPGVAEFSVILRDTAPGALRAIEAAMRQRIAGVAAAHGLAHRIAEMSWLPPVGLDAGLARLLHAEAARLGIDVIDMVSGAGHDAQTMQGFCPAALVFVPSRGGVSHAPEEWTEPADIVQGTRLMLAAMMRLSGPGEAAR